MIIPTVTIETIDVKTIYIRHRGGYADFRKKSNSLFRKLFDFGFKHDVIKEGISKALTMYDDNPYITAEKDLRTSVAITLSNDNSFDEEEVITRGNIQGKYAIFHFSLKRSEYDQAWKYIYNVWTKESSYTLRDAAPFEVYVENPQDNKSHGTKVDIYIPIT